MIKGNGRSAYTLGRNKGMNVSMFFFMLFIVTSSFVDVLFHLPLHFDLPGGAELVQIFYPAYIFPSHTIMDKTLYSPIYESSHKKNRFDAYVSILEVYKCQKKVKKVKSLIPSPGVEPGSHRVSKFESDV